MASKSLPTLLSLAQPVDLALLGLGRGDSSVQDRERGRSCPSLPEGGAYTRQNFEIVRLYLGHLPTSLSVLLLTISSRSLLPHIRKRAFTSKRDPSYSITPLSPTVSDVPFF